MLHLKFRLMDVPLVLRELVQVVRNLPWDRRMDFVWFCYFQPNMCQAAGLNSIVLL